MVPKLRLLIEATILSINFGILSSYVTSNCGKEPFRCGNIEYIKHPFWLGGVGCGPQGFQIICNDGIPLINISSLTYQLHQLDFSSNTLKIARQDLQNNACPQILRNTTIDLRRFRFPTKSNDRNLTLYLDCTGDQLESFPNKVNCTTTVNLFKAGAPASGGPGADVRCKSVIFVPINHEAAKALEDPTVSSINILLSALSSGFSIHWLNQISRRSWPFCDWNLNSTCVKPTDGFTTFPGKHHGLPPVQSQAYPPQSLSNHRRRNAGKSPHKEIAIVVALTVTGVITLSIAIAIRCSLKTSTPNPKSKQNVENFLLQHGSLTPKRFRYSEIKKITKSLSDKLGQGGYGSVYKGMLPDGCPVAVKVLIETDSNGEEFINEVASISRTSHVNIVTLLGFCYERNRRALVYEYMPNKSLDKFLEMECRLDLEKLYKIAVGTAKGLKYLHTGCTTRIIHFDIKPQNILLDQDLCPKISDFGLAKLCKKQQSILSVLGTRGTIGYIAPEVFSRNFGGVSHKSDVYSYGMMLLEMAGAREISEGEVIKSSESYFPDKIYEQVMIDVCSELGDSMIEEKEEMKRKMFLVGFWCIQTIPSNRPSISKVVDMLEGSIGSIQIPPKPFFSPHLPRNQVSSSLSAYIETENSARYLVRSS